jgi:hypothetical protein
MDSEIVLDLQLVALGVPLWGDEHAAPGVDERARLLANLDPDTFYVDFGCLMMRGCNFGDPAFEDVYRWVRQDPVQ